MEDLVTADLILQWLKERVANKEPISPQLWLDAAMKLNALSSDETDKLIELESIVAQLRTVLIESGKSVASARAFIEAGEPYKQLRRQQEKLKQIIEAIRLAKLSARIKSEEMRSGL